MKTISSYIIIFFIGLNTVAIAQFGSQQIISTDASLPRAIKVADINGDGDIDVLSASYGDDTIAWYENLDGLGNFGSLRLISNTLEGTQHLYAADIDGDGDIDVVADSRVDDIVVWYENLDGLGNFSSAITISTSAINPKEVIAADLDGDNDNDVIVASRDDNKVAWYENLDGQGNFGSERIISSNVPQAISIYASDLDGDLDIDIIAFAAGNQSLYWVKNLDGNGNFGTLREISNNSLGISSVLAADLDNDGDNDVVSILTDEGIVNWYENLNGAGSFGTEQIINGTLEQGRSVFVVDLDNDLDNDVVWTDVGSDEIAWQQNDSSGNFSSKQVISNDDHFVLASLSVADIDGDGINDIIASSVGDNKIAWYRNELLSTPTFSINQLKIVPNPVLDVLTLQNTEGLEINDMVIYDIMGRLVLKDTNTSTQIDMTHLLPGIYLLQINTATGVFTRRVVKE